MTVSTLRPDSTLANGGTLVGAATAHEALADDSDASYVALTDGLSASLTLADFTLPAGSVLKNVVLRERASGSGQLLVRLTAGADPAMEETTGGVPPTTGGVRTVLSSPTTLSWPPATGWTVVAINGSSLLIEHQAPMPAVVDINVYALYVDVTHVAAPVTTVTSPSGTVSNTNRPTVVWEVTTDSDGGARTHYEVKVFTEAQYTAGGFDPATSTPQQASGIVAGTALTWRTPDILPNLTTYRAYVRAAQTINGAQHWSPLAFSTFTIDVALPAAPTMTLTPQSTAGRVKIDLSANTGDATTDALELEHSTDGGTTWTGVRNSEGDTGWISASSATVYDYEALNGAATQYRARALHDYSGEFAASDWATGSTTWTSTDWWVKDPLVPSANVPVELVTYGEVVRAARHAVIQPLGATYPVVIADTRAGVTGTSTVRTRTTAEKESVEATAARLATLLLQGPAESGEPDRYVWVGDLSTVRLIENVAFAYRTLTLPWVEVELPAGAQTGDQYVASGSGDEELVVA